MPEKSEFEPSEKHRMMDFDSESLNDDREKLEKANKTIEELSKNLKIKEAELAETKSCYRLYIKKARSVIGSLQNDAEKRSEAEEK